MGEVSDLLCAPNLQQYLSVSKHCTMQTWSMSSTQLLPTVRGVVGWLRMEPSHAVHYFMVHPFTTQHDEWFPILPMCQQPARILRNTFYRFCGSFFRNPNMPVAQACRHFKGKGWNLSWLSMMVTQRLLYCSSEAHNS